MTANKRGMLKSWADIERLFSLVIPDIYKGQEFNYANLSSFTRWWQNSFEFRLQTAFENQPKMVRIKLDHNVSTFGGLTLTPEQEGVYKSIYNALFVEGRIKSALCDGQTGLGKTIIATAVIARLAQDGLFQRPEMFARLHPIMIFAPKGVCEHWRRELARAGLGDLVRKRKIYIESDSVFTTEYGDALCSEEEDFYTESMFYKWNPLVVPYLCIPDECHRYVRWASKRHKKMLAMVKDPLDPRFLFMSATPAETVNDMALFAISCRTRFMDIDVNENNFKYFSGLVDPIDPSKPNAEAMKRVRGILSDHIFSIPYIKPKHKAINRVIVVDFLNEADRLIYDSAHERYREACRKSGKNTLWGRFEKFVALCNFNKTAEPLRAWYLAEEAAKDYASGKVAPVVFSAYKETITEVAFRLIDKYHVPREHIAIIWGGKREYKSDELLTREQLNEISATKDLGVLLEDKVLLKRVRLSLRYFQDQIDHAETTEEQTYRHSRLKELKLLGKQSDDARQIEIDRFQDGSAKICLATIASGGIGLSLDKNKEFLLDRHGLFTPIYSGKTYKQALGRLVRRMSLADAIQDTVMLKGTTEEYHIAPILDEKLKSMAAFTNRAMEDIIDLLSKEAPVVKPPVHLRTLDEAAIDAEKVDTVIESPVEEDDEECEDIKEVGDLIG